MNENGTMKNEGAQAGLAGSPEAPVLPLYLVVDRSQHMHEAVNRLHGTLYRIINYFHDNPVLSHRVRLTIIYFNDDARKGMDWGDMTSEWPDDVPPMRARGSKWLRKGVWKLNEELARHLSRTTYRAVTVLDPLAFVVTSDAPDDGEDWSDALERVRTGTTASTASTEVWRALVACLVHTDGASGRSAESSRTVEQLDRLATEGRACTYDRLDDLVAALYQSVTGSAAASVEGGATVLVPPGGSR